MWTLFKNCNQIKPTCFCLSTCRKYLELLFTFYYITFYIFFGHAQAAMILILDTSPSSSCETVRGLESMTVWVFKFSSEAHNGRPLFIFITGLVKKKTKFWSAILKSFWDFFNLQMILESIWSCAPVRILPRRGAEQRIKKTQNDLRIMLQNFVFL